MFLQVISSTVISTSSLSNPAHFRLFFGSIFHGSSSCEYKLMIIEENVAVICSPPRLWSSHSLPKSMQSGKLKRATHCTSPPLSLEPRQKRSGGEWHWSQKLKFPPLKYDVSISYDFHHSVYNQAVNWRTHVRSTTSWIKGCDSIVLEGTETRNKSYVSTPVIPRSHSKL